jgi:hypothetical protein
VRILLRNGISFGTFQDIAKWVYVKTAAEEFGIENRKQTTSRISILTGLSRKEVKRVRENPRPDDDTAAEKYNRAARVIAAWRREDAYTDNEGKPLSLPLNGEGPSFDGLVRRFSGDMPHRAILDELTNAKAVEKTADGKVRLISSAYLPSADDEALLHILGTDTGHLIDTIGHNLVTIPPHRRFQRKVRYDNLPSEAIPVFHDLAAKASQKLLEDLDRWLANNDRDANKAIEGTGRHSAGVGIYFFTEDLAVKEDES